ncbi:MAG: 50S ribosomal protein L25/general stress protein Ctc [Pseudomonadota bacterium]
MAKGFALQAAVRERTGKGAARALRREGLIPAVIYGNNEPAVPISVSQKEMTLALGAGGFMTNIWSIDVGGTPVQALARDYQREPVKDRLIHVDFLRVTERTRVTVDVPISFVDENESPGLSTGGVLNVAQFTVSVEAAATGIPDNITVSVAGLEMGATITSADITLPAGVAFASQSDEPFPIASIAAPAVEVSDEEADAPSEPSDEGAGGDGAEDT